MKLIIKCDTESSPGSLDYNRAISEAAAVQQSQAVEFLLEKGADVNTRVYNDVGTLLDHAVCRRGNHEIVKLLIQHGGTLSIASKADYSHTLFEAAGSGHEDAVRLLISAAVEIERREAGYPAALHGAINKGQVTTAKLLIHSAMDLELKIANHIDVYKEYTPLIEASGRNYQDLIEDLIAAGAIVNYRTSKGLTAMGQAIIKGHCEIVRILVKNGARADEENNNYDITPVSQTFMVEAGIHNSGQKINHDSGNEFHLAVALDDVEVVKILAGYKANINLRTAGQDSPLHLAARNGSIDILKVLLANSAEIDAVNGSGRTAFDLAAEYHQLDFFEILVNHKVDIFKDRNNNALYKLMYMATTIGHGKVIKSLIDFGIDVEVQDGLHGTPLQNACVFGHDTVVSILIESGASPDTSGGYYGNALQAAAAHGRVGIIRLLLSRGAKVNAVGGWHGTALRAAVEAGHEEVVALLLAHHADVDTFQSDSNNALLAACINDFSNIVITLLQNKANINVRGSWYGNPLEAALACGHEQVIDILLENGAEFIE